MAFTPEELERYARHIVLHEVGGPGQARLRDASVLVIGAGGLGSPALLYLAAAGVGRIGIVDDDTVSLSNLHRQIIHGTADIGRPKVASAAERIAAVNPHVAVETHGARLGPSTADALLGRYGLVLDGSDNFDTRYLANAACVRARVPLIGAALSRWEGQLSLYAPHLGGPCLACAFPERPDPGLVPPCAEAGVMGALAGVIGALMASEAIKHITGAGETLMGRLLLWNGLEAEARTIRVTRRPGCPVCGAAAG
jgi:molybdopterin/thiamine biosynthesis adenylyltransferase